jgi:hypothetical protein
MITQYRKGRFTTLCSIFDSFALTVKKTGLFSVFWENVSKSPLRFLGSTGMLAFMLRCSGDTFFPVHENQLLFLYQCKNRAKLVYLQRNL